MYKLFSELINDICKRYSSGNAFSYRIGDEIAKKTFADVYEEVNRISAVICERNWNAKKIILMATNSIEWVMVYLAMLYIEGTIFLIDPNNDEETILSQVNQCNADVIIYSSTMRPATAQQIETSIHIKMLYNLKPSGSSNDNIYCKSKTQGRVIFFTSGTTAKQKPVALSFGNIFSVVEAQSICCTLGNRYLSVLPFTHSLGNINGILGVFFQGCENHICFSISSMTREINQFNPDTMILVPRIIEQMRDRISRDCSTDSLSTSQVISGVVGNQLQYIVSGGAYLDISLFDFFHKLGIVIINGYGITECSPLISVNQIQGNKPESVGRVIPCCEVKVVKENLSQEYGEIFVRGNNVIKEYYDKNWCDGDEFDGEWFKTGDLGMLDKNGYLYIVGRKKNIIILPSGINISPEELEAKLIRIPGIEEVIVEMEREKRDGLVAKIFPTEHDAPTDETNRIDNEIRKINKKLPKYKRIRKTIYVNIPFPKTLTGKIRRNIDYTSHSLLRDIEIGSKI